MATDAEMIMLLNGLERMILLSLAYTSEISSSEEDNMPAEKSGSENSGLLGYVSNVFGSESVQQMPEEQLTVGVLVFTENLCFSDVCRL